MYRKHDYYLLFLFLFVFGYITNIHAESENIEQLLQEADTYFQQEKYIEPKDSNAYVLYRRVLKIEPDNRHAQRKIYEIANVYYSLSEKAEQKGDDGWTEAYYQQYWIIVEDLLPILIEQADRYIEQYSRLVEAEKNGEHVAEEIVAVLHNNIELLGEIQAIYKHSQQNEAENQVMIKNLQQVIDKFKQDLVSRQHE